MGDLGDPETRLEGANDMPKAWKFGTAIEFLNAWRGKDTVVAGVDEDYYAAEEFALSARPHTAQEAAALIEIIRENVEGGARSDGLDLMALDNLLDWTNAQVSEPSGRMLESRWILPLSRPFQRERRDGA